MLFAYFDTAYYLLPIPRTACKQNRLPAEVHWINQCNAATYLQLSPGQQIRLFTKTVSQQQSCLKSGNSLCLLCLISKKLVISPAGVAQWTECGLQTKWSPVQFPDRAHAWVAGQVLSVGHTRGNHTRYLFPSFSLSLPCSLKINK